MPKWSSYVSRFFLLLLSCALLITGVSYGLSNYYYNEMTVSTQFTALADSLVQAEALLQRYISGKTTHEELVRDVNPALNPDGNFYLLLDENFSIIACSDAAVPFLSGDALDNILTSLKNTGGAIVLNEEIGTAALVTGKRTPGGVVLAGRPVRIHHAASISFSSRMLISMGIMLLIVLLLSSLATQRVSRPARMIAETAEKLIRGEQTVLPEDMPGKELRDVAQAFNHLSQEVSAAIRDLRTEKETMETVLEGLTEGVLAIDGEGNLLHENNAAKALLCAGSPERGQVLQALRLPDDKQMDEGKIVRSDSVLYYGISRLEQNAGTVALVRDITQQEYLERTRHDYVANISHELRTPLASMRGLAEALRDGVVVEETDKQRYYNIIVDEVTRLSRLVNDLLELSSLQSNPTAFEMETVDPNELIYDLHDRNESLFHEKDLHFVRDLPDEPLPDIRSNEDRLSQVLTIFLDNARKYTPQGGTVTLSACIAENGIRFAVRDTGIGMDEETQKLAFERFHQAERGRSDKGSGLGLSIAREVLQKMGIAIELESAPGRGSCFSFIVKNGEREGKL